MNIVFLNYFFDADLKTEDELLRRYRGTTEWCSALLRAGASQVTVVQRFWHDSVIKVNDITYYFVTDGLGNITTPVDNFSKLHQIVANIQPDIVHHNGWSYPLIFLRALLPKTTAIVWQHHGGGIPQWYSQFFYRTGFRAVDSFLFTSKEIAAPWKKLTLLNHFQDIYEVNESSSTFTPKNRDECRAKLGLEGNEIFLWVGRLDSNKDPLTILKGFKEIVKALSNPHLYMIYHEGNLNNEVKHTIAQMELYDNVHLLGRQPHHLLEFFYNAADFFVLGSHHEGSGFALLEALACGATPLVTSIPSFKKLTNNGEVGELWETGSTNSFIHAVHRASAKKQERKKIVQFFNQTLSYDALGKQALNAYEQTYRKRNSSKKKIAVVVPGGIDSPESGLQIPNLVQYLSKLSGSFDMTIYSLIRISKSRDEYKCGNATVIFLGSEHEYSLASKLFRLLRTLFRDGNRFDLFHGLWGMPTGFATVIVSKILNKPSIVSLLGGETANIPEINYGNLNHPLLRRLTLWTCNNADSLITLTSFQRKQLQQVGITRDNIFVIPFGIEPAMFPPNNKELSQHEIHFLHVGSIIPVKAHEMLLHTFKIISEQIPCKLRLIGVDYRNGKIQSLVNELGLTGHVSFCGYTPYENMREHYSWADILLHTSYHEAQGLVIVEAASSGVLLCGTNVGLLSDFSPVQAVAVEVGDAHELASQVLRLLQNPERMNSHREKAFDWANSHTINWTVNQTKIAYQKLFESKERE